MIDPLELLDRIVRIADMALKPPAQCHVPELTLRELLEQVETVARRPCASSDERVIGDEAVMMMRRSFNAELHATGDDGRSRDAMARARALPSCRSCETTWRARSPASSFPTRCRNGRARPHPCLAFRRTYGFVNVCSVAGAMRDLARGRAGQTDGFVNGRPPHQGDRPQARGEENSAHRIVRARAHSPDQLASTSRGQPFRRRMKPSSG